MSEVKVSIKWGKEVFSDIEVNLQDSPLVFKSQLFALTGVPPDRQKVMIKGALLKDDEWGKAQPKDGATVMLMGSAEPKIVEPPKDIPKFVEDLPEHQQAHLATQKYGSGLQNLGNTCYMNSVVQCMYAVQPLRDTLKVFKPSAPDAAGNLVVAARELMQDMESGGEPFAPFAFLLTLRERYPQFAQQTRQGVYAQQDAEECWTNIMHTFREKLKDGNGESEIKKLFAIGSTLKLKSEESGEELQESVTNYSLRCNIDGTVNHLSEGIALGLKDDREKMSEKLGKTVLFQGNSVLTSLPPYMTIQMVRFFYKVDTQSKAKVLRKVAYQMEFDAYEFCSPELKQALEGPRAAYKAAQDRLIEAQRTKKMKPSGETAPAPAAAASDAAASTSAAPMETDAGAAASSSGDAAQKDNMELDAAGPSSYVGAQTGKYELIAVLTHKGRSVDSGHYVAWVKQQDKTWMLFDDADLIPKKEEDILALSGGGDWHMAYLLIYRAITVPDVPEVNTAKPAGTA